MYLLHVRFDSVQLLSALDIHVQYLGKYMYINILTDFDPCSHRRANITFKLSHLRQILQGMFDTIINLTPSKFDVKLIFSVF